MKKKIEEVQLSDHKRKSDEECVSPDRRRTRYDEPEVLSTDEQQPSR